MSGLSKQSKCPRGHFCKNPKNPPVQCPPGTYQPYKARSRCKDCERGFNCSAPALTKPQTCQKGFHCNNTALPQKCADGKNVEKLIHP